MVPLWRLTRNRYGRRVYDALGRVGITATSMYEYVRRLDDPPTSPPAPAADTVGVCDPAEVTTVDSPTNELRGDERVVGAFQDGLPVGYLFVSIDASHEISPLERTISFDGAYIRRVFVDPAHRNGGIAAALVSTACKYAYSRGADTATALVALDNVPSRALFTGRGFEPRRVRRYARVGPVSHRSNRLA